MSKKEEQSNNYMKPIILDRNKHLDDSNWSLGFDYMDFTGNEMQIAFEDGWDAAVNEAIKWLENNANAYIYNTTPSYPDADFKAKIGGMCWINLKKFVEE